MPIFIPTITDVSNPPGPASEPQARGESGDEESSSDEEDSDDEEDEGPKAPIELLGEVGNLMENQWWPKKFFLQLQ